MLITVDRCALCDHSGDAERWRPCPECGLEVEAHRSKPPATPRRPHWRVSDPRWRRRYAGRRVGARLGPAAVAAVAFSVAEPSMRVPAVARRSFERRPCVATDVRSTLLSWSIRLFPRPSVDHHRASNFEQHRRRGLFDWTRRRAMLKRSACLRSSARCTCSCRPC